MNLNYLKHKGQRVAMFIDTQNLYHGAKNIHGAKVNFQNILLDAVQDRQLIRAFAYVINTETEEEKVFFDALEKMGIEIKIKDIQIFNSGNMKADWDIGLAIDTIKLAPKLDTIILVSGDGDFEYLITYLQNTFGCRVEVVGFGKSSSYNLKERADDFIDLSNNPSRYLIFKKRIEKNISKNYGKSKRGK